MWRRVDPNALSLLARSLIASWIQPRKGKSTEPNVATKQRLPGVAKLMTRLKRRQTRRSRRPPVGDRPETSRVPATFQQKKHLFHPKMLGKAQVEHHDHRARINLKLQLSREQPRAVRKTPEVTRVVIRHPWRTRELRLKMMAILSQMKISALLIELDLLTGPRRSASKPSQRNSRRRWLRLPGRGR
jgi:hypothetical protein